ncbi:hypothetical protein [Frigidibacter sp.]|uniref:hypothetical protein n=1 Tax=Frigidibacter sp. TaxID=2586418 RepID=UPI0027370CB8|nr:hypothetical protein [Frigidibacter sp.]MDP3339977.1 hypothetical protein [Frigidibacter sp.]
MSDDTQVAERRVFYIPGYDPIHPRRYRELYRREGAEQARLAGYTLALRPKQGGGAYGWHVEAQIEGASTEADIDVLVWSDIVRGSMGQSILATYGQLVRTAWVYIASGALFRLMRLRKGPMIAALYPVGMLLGQLALALLAGRLTGGLAAWGGAAAGLPALLATALGWTLAAATFAFVLLRFRRADPRFYAYYLMHDFAYSARWQGANPPELEARMAEFGATIAEALTQDWDEVLIVGHSSGAHLAISILADLIREGRVPATGPVLSLLTLGQVVPMVSFLPKAQRLRRDLRDLSQRPELTWIDVTAPGDGCAFALCDPVSVTGVAPPGKRWPLVLTAAFTRTLSPARWKALRWRFFRLHFQYLCAFDALPGEAGDYDYFRITAGPRSLAARLGGRSPAKSRIETPVNRYTDCG